MSVNYKRLGDIATYINGYAFKPKDWRTKGLPIIRIQNLTGSSNEINFYDGEIDEKYIVRKGDILIAWSASLGVYEWNGEVALLNQHIFKVVFDKEKINKNFFKFMVQKVLERTQKYLHGSTMKHITKKYFDDLLIPFPPLEIQEKIADILMFAESLIYKRKSQIKALDQLTQSVFLEMFGDPFKNPKKWDVKLLEEVMIGSPQNGLYKPSSEYTKEGGTSILRIDSFYNGKIINLKQLKRLNCTEKEISTYRLNINDIVINRVNSLEYLGKCALVDNLIENTVFESNMMRIKVNSDIVNPKYLVVHLCSKFLYNQIINKAKKSVNQASINQQDVKSFNIIVPPIELQNKFDHIAKQIEQHKEKFLEGLYELEACFNSLKHLAFTGQLFTEDKASNL